MEIVLNSTKDIIKRKKNRNIYVNSNKEEIDENKIIKMIWMKMIWMKEIVCVIRVITI